VSLVGKDLIEEDLDFIIEGGAVFTTIIGGKHDGTH
jgi:hypothetical protein